MPKFKSLILEREDFRVTLDYVGEGVCGDYDPDDEQDEPRLRFYCDKLSRAYGEWCEVDDASYCTLFTITDPPITLLKFMLLILDVIESEASPRRSLQLLTHKTVEDLND